MTNIDTKLMQTYKTAGYRRDMIKDGSCNCHNSAAWKSGWHTSDCWMKQHQATKLKPKIAVIKPKIFTVDRLLDGSFEFIIDGQRSCLTREQAKILQIYLKEKLNGKPSSS